MATPVFACGFECGQLGTVGQHWDTTTGISIATAIKRSGDRSFRANPSASSTCSVNSHTLASSAIWVWRVYVYFTTLPNGNTTLICLDPAGGTPGLMFKASDSKLYPGSDNVSGSTGFSVTTGVWYRCDVKVNLSANPWTIDVQVDGTALTQQTIALGATSGTYLKLGSNGLSHSSDHYFDDVLVSHTAADYPLGAGYVNHFVPTADGAHNVAGAADFKVGAAGVDITNATTTAYQLIDEVPLDDVTPDTNDYINMIAPPNATDYTEHVIGPAPGVSTPTAGPRAVEAIIGIHQASAAAGNMEVRLNDNGTTGVIYTATGVIGTTGIIYQRAHFADPPSAASVWNAANDGGNGDFRDLRVRFGSPAAVDANPDQYLDCVMIEAEFEEVAAGAGQPARKRLGGVQFASTAQHGNRGMW